MKNWYWVDFFGEDGKPVQAKAVDFCNSHHLAPGEFIVLSFESRKVSGLSGDRIAAMYFAEKEVEF